jgi:hypothetical protein
MAPRTSAPAVAASFNRGGPKGTGAPGQAGGLPADYAYQERLMSQRADNSRITGAARSAPAIDAPMPGAGPGRTSYSPPANRGVRPDQDYRVPAGQAPMPSAPQLPPAGSTASRANAVMAPLGASRNEALVQAAGNAGMRLADPAAFKMFAGEGVMPATSEDVSRRMLSEFGSGRPALTPTAAFDTSSEQASAAISPRTLTTAAAAFTPAATGGDRFSGLRPDLAQWARANQNAARGVDGMNIVERFMAKQGAAMPLSGPSTMGFADGRQVVGPFADVPSADDMPLTGPSTIGFADGRQVTGDLPEEPRGTGLLPTSGFNIGLSAEAQTQMGNAFKQPSAVDPAAAFGPAVSPLDQVQALREMYRNNSRPNPGITAATPWNY